MGVLYKTTKSYRARKEEISFCLNRIQIDHVAWGRAFLLSLPSRFACCVFVLTALAALWLCGCIRSAHALQIYCWILDGFWILDLEAVAFFALVAANRRDAAAMELLP
jgi:hypothetical protein